MSQRGELRVLDDGAAVARVAAEETTRRLAAAADASGRASFVLSGGSTPLALYRLLADPHGPCFAAFPWERTDFFWGDERCVPPTHDESNFRAAREALHLPFSTRVPAENVHRILGEKSPPQAAHAYEEEIYRQLELPHGELPRFDVVLLGLGPEGHTASLFPGDDLLAGAPERGFLVADTFVDKLHAFRVTLTPRALNAAAAVLFLVSGESKAEALAAALATEGDPLRLPARAIRPPTGDLLWLADPPAARRL